MQTAADSASIAALSQKSPGFVAASAMTGNGSVTDGVADANNVFDANMNGITGYQNLVRSSTVTKTGIKLAASVTYTADVPVTFLKVIGYQKLTVTGVSSSAATLPPYLDFYLTLDVSGSMGLPSTPAEQTRLGKINPDNWVQYRNSTGVSCTLACHFSPKGSACVDPPVVPPAAPAANPSVTSSYSQQYNTNGYCMGYIYSRLGQTALNNLINQASTPTVQKQVPGLPVTMLPDLNNTVTPGVANSLIKGNSKSRTDSLTAVSSCPTDGTDDCIQLRLDAVGYAVNQLFVTANASMKVSNQFRIGLYPFIQKLYAYFPLTSSINGSATNSTTINYAAANLATLLDTNMSTDLGSGGTHIDTALTSVNGLISGGGTSAVGDGSTPTTPQPYVFLVTDGAQDNQYKDVPNGNWHGSNQATTIDKQKTLTTVPECETLKGRGVIVSVLYIPYQPVSPVVTTFAGNEDTYANNNIQYIPASLQKCASPGFFYTANTPADIAAALNAMFNHALQTAHITN